MTMNRRTFVTTSTGMVGAALFAPHLARAAGYPEKPINLIIPFAAGGSSDAAARIFATGLSEVLQQQVIPDNRPGAGGATAGGIAAQADPDGYTLLWGGLSTLAVGPAVYQSVPYDPLTSFTPIGRVMYHAMALTINSSLPANNLTEFVELVKANPGAYNYGSGGVGSIHQLAAELFKTRAGVELQHVPYQGNGPALTDLLGGTIHMMFLGLPHVLPQKDNERLRLLAVTSTEEDPSLPGIPTMESFGYEGFDVAQSSFGVLSPAGVSDEIVARLVEATHEVTKLETVSKAISNAGMYPVEDTPEQYATWIQNSLKTWTEVAASAGISL